MSISSDEGYARAATAMRMYEPSHTFEPSQSVAPMPIKLPSSTVQAWSNAECPAKASRSGHVRLGHVQISKPPVDTCNMR